MNIFKRMLILLCLVLVLSLLVEAQVLAQIIRENDGTTLKQIIIFGRHNIRSATHSPEELAQYAVDPYPEFEVPPGCLTPNGRKAARLLGAYFRQYLLAQGLITGNDQQDLSHSYFRSKSKERSWETAKAFGKGLITNVNAPVHSYNIGEPDPVFDPIAAGVAQVDANVAAQQAQAIYNSGAALASAYSGEYSLMRSVLFNNGPVPPGKVDPTAIPITLTANTKLKTGSVINVGGLKEVKAAADPFMMQYADNFPMSDVAWGRLTPNQISQVTRLVILNEYIQTRTPYLKKVQSSNAASHILRTMLQAIKGLNFFGAFGNAKSRMVVVISTDTCVSGLAGLLNVHWQLPGYQQDYCALGGALVFELRQVNGETNSYLVRVYYTAQTLDQLRNLTPLSISNPPATIQLLVPDGSKSDTNLDIDFSVFKRLLTKAIGQEYVEDPRKETPPDVLTGVICQGETEDTRE